MCCKIDKAAFLTLTARHSPLKERFQKIAADRARVVLFNSAVAASTANKFGKSPTKRKLGLAVKVPPR